MSSGEALYYNTVCRECTGEPVETFDVPLSNIVALFIIYPNAKPDGALRFECPIGGETIYRSVGTHLVSQLRIRGAIRQDIKMPKRRAPDTSLAITDAEKNSYNRAFNSDGLTADQFMSE